MGEHQLGDAIRYYRRKKGLSQEKVAEAMEVSRQAVTKWENGSAHPSSEHFIRLAQLFGVGVEELLGGGRREEAPAGSNVVRQEEVSVGANSVQQETPRMGSSVMQREEIPAGTDAVQREKVITETNAVRCEDSPEGINAMRREVSLEKANVAMGRAPWILTGISMLCLAAYAVCSILQDAFSPGTLICMFVLCVPIQLFWQIYVSNAIRTGSFGGIAGFDDRTEYDLGEVGKLLAQINLHIGTLSTVFVFLFGVTGSAEGMPEWFGGFLMLTYSFLFVTAVEAVNYRWIDKLYLRKEEKKRARRSMKGTVVYSLLLFIGIGIAGVLFERREIENNTAPAGKLCGLLLLGVLIATVGFLVENRAIKKWDPDVSGKRMEPVTVASFAVCVIVYGLMCITR